MGAIRGYIDRGELAAIPSSNLSKRTAVVISMMDSAPEVAVRHGVAFTTLNIRHSFDVSPSILSAVRELRFALVAAVFGWATVSIVRTVVTSWRATDSSP